MKKSYLTLALAVVALVVCMGSAQANFVPPGTIAPLPPDALTIGALGSPGVLLASTGPITVTSGVMAGSVLTVTYFENVYADPFGLCAGCLDFVIQATNDSAPPAGFVASNQPILHVTTGNYSPLQGPTDLDMGTSTGVGLFTSDGLPVLPVTAIPPTGVLRPDPAGISPEFDFGAGVAAAGPAPGNETTYLILKTTALSYIPGTVSFQDDVTALGAGFAPAPEPRMVGLALLGMLAVVAAYRRKRVA